MNLLDEDVTWGACHAFTFVVGDDGVVSPYVDGTKSGFAVDEFPLLGGECFPVECFVCCEIACSVESALWALFSASDDGWQVANAVVVEAL